MTHGIKTPDNSEAVAVRSSRVSLHLRSCLKDSDATAFEHPLSVYECAAQWIISRVWLWGVVSAAGGVCRKADGGVHV